MKVWEVHIEHTDASIWSMARETRVAAHKIFSTKEKAFEYARAYMEEQHFIGDRKIREIDSNNYVAVNQISFGQVIDITAIEVDA